MAAEDLDALYRRLDRLASALEHLVQNQSRRLAQDEHNEARARTRLQATGGSTQADRNAHEKKLRKKGLL